MRRYKTIHFQGTPILSVNLTSIHEKEALETITGLKSFIAEQDHHSLRILTRTNGSRFTQKILNTLIDLCDHNHPYVLVSAIVAPDPYSHMIIQTIQHRTCREFAVFESDESALAWLVSPHTGPEN